MLRPWLWFHADAEEGLEVGGGGFLVGDDGFDMAET